MHRDLQKYTNYSYGGQFKTMVANNIRVDTHKENEVMQHSLDGNGFKRWGIIYLLNGDSRIAFQLA